MTGQGDDGRDSGRSGVGWWVWLALACMPGCAADPPGPGFLGDGDRIELCQGVVDVPDPVLREVLLEVVPQPPPPEDLPEGEMPEPVIMADLLRSVRGLNAPSRGITDLRGLECAQGLISLGLADNEITDVTPLLDLTGLEQLELSKNEITDLSALGRLFRLTRLAIDENGITSLGPLAGLQRLEALDAARNEITSVEPLSGLEQLAVLVLSDNAVSDVGSLAGLVELRGLEIDDNDVRSLEPLSGLSKLRFVDLDGNAIVSLEPLSDSVDMQEIEASRNELTSLAGVEQMVLLTRIAAQENAITSTAGVESLGRLSVLDLSDNAVESLQGVQGLSNLQSLRLALNRVSDLSPLSGLPELRDLDLRLNEGLTDLKVLGTLPLLGSVAAGGYGQQQDLSPLAGRAVLRSIVFVEGQVPSLAFFGELPSLEVINFSDTPLSAERLVEITQATTLQGVTLDGAGISDLSPLEPLPLMEAIIARDNAITRIDTLAAWTNLRTARLQGNPLESLEGVELHERLSELDVSDTTIADLGPVAGNETFRRGDTIVATGTGLDAGDCGDVAVLRGREAVVEVDLECP